MDDESKLAAVLEPLYASVLEPDQMAQFSATLGAATSSHIGAVMVHDAGHGRGRLDLLFGADPAQAAIYEAEYAGDNLWMQRAHGRMAVGGIMDSDSVATRTELRRTRYYNEYLRLGDIEQSVALCAKADAEGVVVATLCRASGLRPYTERDLALMRQVAPHWANAYAIQRRLSWLEQRVESLESAMEAAPLAMMMLDRTQRVSRMNPQAEHLLGQGDLLRLHQGRPEATRNVAALRQALHEAVAGRSGDGRQLRHAGKVVLKDAAGRNALVASVHPLAGPGRPGACAAVLFLQTVGAANDLGPALRQLFNLTAAESALACALHHSGDLALAATECGIAMTTAQTRIKTVCSKTGERGQASLIRLVAAVAACSR
ncbi:PAS domain-containing protein [Pseudoxanthomonas daejeonensis]|uniref:PAS domain-containing protein n=1 Tax=Pseudoxanthomonas daejeonensis TaxID=266062 RepID=A0ABQ6Z6Q0_9GAMM|nr:PAS domain-containing protein [Pseudoxanthomonas daejeonensis]KAF1694407.1 hypothetical protein CSC65_09515 [Pseudoxanthomonas daejeonensis]